MFKVFTVAWREFKHTALTKTFILAAFGVPVLMFTMVPLIFLLIDPRPRPLTGTLAIVDATGAVIDAAKIEFEPSRLVASQQQWARDETQRAMPVEAPGLNAGIDAGVKGMVADIRIDIQPHRDLGDPNQRAQLIDQLKQQARVGELLGVAVIDPDLLAAELAPPTTAPTTQPAAEPEPPLQLFLAPGTETKHTAMLERTLASSVVRARLNRHGHNVDQTRALLHAPPVATRSLRAAGGEAEENIIARQILPAAFMFLLWIASFTSGNYLLMSTIEEKSNKVMEVLLSAVSPMQLMAGKILGQGLVGLIMLVMYAGLGVGGLLIVAATQSHLVPPLHLLYLFLYFFMAYFMVAAIMASVGSAVSDIREANSLITPAMLVLIIPIMLWLPISDSPNSLFATITSFIPPMIPFVMILRVTAGEAVPFWQIITSLVVGYAAVLGMIWMCAKIFRVGVLMYGKPPSPIELFKWLRYS